MTPIFGMCFDKYHARYKRLFFCYKKFFEFCDLNWNEEIFEFHKRNNLYIKTSSNVQLRTGIQSYDYNKYKRYYSLFEDYKKNYDWLNN